MKWNKHTWLTVCVCVGSGISVWGFRGSFRQPSGSTIRYITSPKCWLGLRDSFSTAVEAGEAAPHPPSGTRQGQTRRSLACEWLFSSWPNKQWFHCLNNVKKEEKKKNCYYPKFIEFQQCCSDFSWALHFLIDMSKW